MSLRDLQSGSESGDDLRLEDISRRSACDRCRSMKTRCERSRHRGIAQLTQCRRCVHAQVRCITTLEGQPSRSQQQQSDRSGQRPRRRTRESSVRPDHGYVPLSAQTTSILSYPGDPTPNRPPPTVLHPSSPQVDPMILADGVDMSNWNDLDDFLHLGAISASDNLPDSMNGPQVGALHTPISARPPSPRNASMDGGEVASQLAAGSQRMIEQTQHELNPTEIFKTDPARTSQCIMARLQEFNVRLLNELQIAREASSRRDGDRLPRGSLLVTTLRYSDMFLQLIRGLRLSASKDEPNRCDKSDMDMVLQLLACNIAICHLYELMCSQLRGWTVSSGEWDKVHTLPSLRLEGLPRIDDELHLSTLAHVSGHLFGKIQKELEGMQRQGGLTQAAHTTLQIALEVTNKEDGKAKIVVDTLRLLAIGTMMNAEAGLREEPDPD
ncbi:hypothetical protein AnigIFM56816_011656 [Aspergillus niger]|nr:hypothetical protein AnigIFM56816_011656 [Aspergillus niger]